MTWQLLAVGFSVGNIDWGQNRPDTPCNTPIFTTRHVIAPLIILLMLREYVEFITPYAYNAGSLPIYYAISVLIVGRIVTLSSLLPYYGDNIFLPFKHETPRRSLLTLPPTLAHLALRIPHHTQRSRVLIPRVSTGLEAEATLDLQTSVTGQIAHVPEGVWLTIEERDDDGGAGGQGWYGALEEGDEEGLVMADLAVHVCGLASDVGEVEDYAIEGCASDGVGEFGGIDVVEEFVVGREVSLGSGWCVWVV